MSFSIRPAITADLEPSDALVVESINHLTSAHGLGPIASRSAPQLQRFCLADDPNGLWVAEETGTMLGFGFSWVCDNLWFLAQLFVSPGNQSRGIGAELLKRTLAQATARRACKRALITFAFNRASQGLYIAHGLFPRCSLYMVSAPREQVMKRLGPECLEVETVSASPDSMGLLDAIDRSALGSSRAGHHRYMLSTGDLRGVSLWRRGSCVGYAYASADGHVGPLAVTETALFGAAFGTALAFAAETAPANLSAFLPGLNHQALAMATSLGMRISLPMLLMSDSEFGDWSRYCPRNPGIM